MNLRDLRYAIAVADLAHFGRAAEACRVSQPTLSGQILKLEEQLRVKIFERNGKTVRPTRVGEEIIAHARRAVAASDEIEVAAQASRDPLTGPIRLGAIPTLAPYLMSRVLPRTRESLPRAPIILVEETTERVLSLLIDGKLDAVLIATLPDFANLEQRELFDDPFLLAMPPSHPLASRRQVGVDDIEPGALLLLSDGHCLRDQALELCGMSTGVGATADLRASSLETLLHLVAADYGVTLVPRLAWNGRDGTNGKLVARPIEDARARRRIRMIWRKGAARALAFDKLAGIVRSSAPRFVEKLEPLATG